MIYRTTLVALDGSGGAHAALRRAVRLASDGGRLLHAVAIEDHLPRYAATGSEMREAREERDASFAQVMEEAKSGAAEQQVELRVEVLSGHAAQTTVQHAQRSVSAQWSPASALRYCWRGRQPMSIVSAPRRPLSDNRLGRAMAMPVYGQHSRA